jgi:TonB family protein
VTTIVLTQEFLASRDRVQKMLMISLLAHILFFAWLLLRQEISPEPEGIVEISWLDPVSAPPPQVKAKPEPKVEPRPVVPPAPREEKFVREAEPAPVEPTPQELTANRDLVKKRVAALSPTSLPSSALTATPTTSKSLLQSAPAPAEDPGHKAAAVDLKRSDTVRPVPRTLTRGPEQPTKSAPTLATAPTEKAMAAASVPDMDTVARRTLDGAELAGEIANRPVIEYSMPLYPEWAKDQAIEASVTLYFVVLPDGRVKENIQVQKTAGFGDFDDSAIAALSAWRFEALNGGGAREQWGTITFRFRLTQ